ncbi:MAG: DUF1566 domain-containing protein [Bacteroidales bacterium]
MGIAARVCNNLVLNGYNDWFLPSIDELSLMYQNLKLNGVGDFLGYYYLSSSEYDSEWAWQQDFMGGGQYWAHKYAGKNNRAVRAF